MFIRVPYRVARHVMRPRGQGCTPPTPIRSRRLYGAGIVLLIWGGGLFFVVHAGLLGAIVLIAGGLCVLASTGGRRR